MVSCMTDFLITETDTRMIALQNLDSWIISRTRSLEEVKHLILVNLVGSKTTDPLSLEVEEVFMRMMSGFQTHIHIRWATKDLQIFKIIDLGLRI